MARTRRLGWVLAMAVVLGALLRAPVLDAGFRNDDFLQRAMLDGDFPLERGPTDLFWFAGGDREETARLQDVGYLPWWSAPELRLAMLRPLSSSLIALDHALAPQQPFVQHLHSLLWWGLLLSAAWLVLRRVAVPLAVAIALFVFSLDEAHLVALGWLANRSTLVASSFAMLALWFHLRWRDDGWPRGPWWVAGATTLALAGGEYAFGVLAFIAAYELLGARGSWASRLRALAPSASPIAVYLIARKTLGYGVQDSGFYLEPTAPGYVLTALQRACALIGELVIGLPASWLSGGNPWRGWLIAHQVFEPATWRRLPSWTSWHVLLGLLALALAVWLLRWTRRASSSSSRHVAWLALGSMLALVPAVSSLPGSRLLVGAGFGVAALVGIAANAALERLRSATPIRSARSWALLALMGAVHLALPAQRAWQRSRGFAAYSHMATRWSLDAEIPRSDTDALHVMVVAASDFTTAANLPWLRRFHGLPLPRSYRRLSGASRAHDLARVAPNAIELSVLSTDLSRTATGTLYRSTAMPIAAGSSVVLPGMRVDVLATRGGNPARTRFTFDEPLDDSQRYLFLHARPEGLRRLRLPPVGSTVRLPLAWSAGAIPGLHGDGGVVQILSP